MQSARVTGTYRALRGLSLGGVLTAMSALGHAVGSGATPGLFSMALCLALSCALGLAVADRPGRLLAVLAWLVGGQLLVHLVLVVATHTHEATVHPAPSPLTMIVGHGCAAALVAVALTRVDAIVLALITLLQSAARRMPALPAIPVVPRRSRLQESARPARVDAGFVGALTRRGPPIGLHVLHGAVA